MNSKEYVMPDGKKAVFEYDHDGIGKVTIEAMDMLMGLIADGKKRGEWVNQHKWPNGFFERECSVCGAMKPLLRHTAKINFCPNCGADMRDKDDEYERAVEQMEYDMLYEPTYNPEDGSM